MADGVYPQLNFCKKKKLFDPSTPFMKKGCGGGEKDGGGQGRGKNQKNYVYSGY